MSKISDTDGSEPGSIVEPMISVAIPHLVSPTLEAIPGRIRIGYRRLYHSVGLNLLDAFGNPIGTDVGYMAKKQDGEWETSVFIGQNPAFPVTRIREQYPFIAVGDNYKAVFSVQLAKETFHNGECLTEIVCWKPYTDTRTFDSSDIANQFPRGADTTQYIQRLETVAGFLGLQWGRQILSDVVSENFIIDMGDNSYHLSLSGVTMEVVPKILLSPNQLTVADEDQEPRKQRSNEVILGWLVKAWAEPNMLLQFLALFIPVEIMLSGQSTEEIPQGDLSGEIRQLIEENAGNNKKQLLTFLAQKTGPGLNQRFEALAKQSGLPEWEQDVKDFKRYNHMRNALLHQGQRRISTDVYVERKEVQRLRDITEKYVRLTANLLPDVKSV